MLPEVIQVPLSQQFISLWGAPQQAEILEQRLCLIVHPTYSVS
jgi:hypothetical protein